MELEGQRIAIRAGVTNISGYSAHADQHNLLDFIRRIDDKPSHITLVHGEARARHTLADKINQRWPAIQVTTA